MQDPLDYPNQAQESSYVSFGKPQKQGSQAGLLNPQGHSAQSGDFNGSSMAPPAYSVPNYGPPGTLDYGAPQQPMQYAVPTYSSGPSESTPELKQPLVANEDAGGMPPSLAHKLARVTDREALFVLLGLSCFEIIAAAGFGNALSYGVAGQAYNDLDSLANYAIAVGSLSLSICVILLALAYTKIAPAVVHAVVVVLLSLWWLVAVLVLTFFTPVFESAGNGYLSVWLGFAISCYLVCLAAKREEYGSLGTSLQGMLPSLAMTTTRRLALVIACASAVTLVHASSVCGRLSHLRLVVDGNLNPADCTGAYGFAVAAGCVSLVAAVGYFVFYASVPKAGHILFAVFMACWWLVSTGVGTFQAPFVILSNGYFAEWTAVVAAMALWPAQGYFMDEWSGKPSNTSPLSGSGSGSHDSAYDIHNRVEHMNQAPPFQPPTLPMAPQPAPTPVPDFLVPASPVPAPQHPPLIQDV